MNLKEVESETSGTDNWPQSNRVSQTDCELGVISAADNNTPVEVRCRWMRPHMLWWSAAVKVKPKN